MRGGAGQAPRATCPLTRACPPAAACAPAPGCAPTAPSHCALTLPPRTRGLACRRGRRGRRPSPAPRRRGRRQRRWRDRRRVHGQEVRGVRGGVRGAARRKGGSGAGAGACLGSGGSGGGGSSSSRAVAALRGGRLRSYDAAGVCALGGGVGARGMCCVCQWGPAVRPLHALRVQPRAFLLFTPTQHI